jgi:hypothetical protein
MLRFGKMKGDDHQGRAALVVEAPAALPVEDIDVPAALTVEETATPAALTVEETAAPAALTVEETATVAGMAAGQVFLYTQEDKDER